MIIKMKKEKEGIHKGALGIAYFFKNLDISLKDLSEDKKRELIKILGDRVEEFLRVFDIKYRIVFHRNDVDNLSDLSLPLFDFKDSEDFEFVKDEDLTIWDKKTIREIKDY